MQVLIGRDDRRVEPEADREDRSLVVDPLNVRPGVLLEGGKFCSVWPVSRGRFGDRTERDTYEVRFATMLLVWGGMLVELGLIRWRTGARMSFVLQSLWTVTL